VLGAAACRSTLSLGDSSMAIAPVVDPKVSLQIANIALYGWPILVTGSLLLIRRRQIDQRLAFAILGYLVCVGIQALIRLISFTIFWVRIPAATPGDIIMSKIVNTSLSVSIFSAMASVLPVLWLDKLLRAR
jgi:hypothetical protein